MLDDVESDVDNDLEYPDLLDNRRVPMSICRDAIFFMFKVMSCIMAINMYNNFESQNYASKMNGTIFSRI